VDRGSSSMIPRMLKVMICSRYERFIIDFMDYSPP
jgi:hypothetical protein